LSNVNYANEELFLPHKTDRLLAQLAVLNKESKKMEFYFFSSLFHFILLSFKNNNKQREKKVILLPTLPHF
jgi:hypothetical protein